MFFPGPKLNTVFASRWKALLWAGGVLLTAYCSIPSPDEDGSTGAAHAAEHPAHTNPWALDPKDNAES